MEALDNAIASFAYQCAASKGRMTGDVVEQLQRISAQQSRIRDVKTRLAAFNEVRWIEVAAVAAISSLAGSCHQAAAVGL